MTDVVSRLRQQSWCGPLHTEAANEIERLRAREDFLDLIISQQALALMQIRARQGDPIQIAREAMDASAAFADEQNAPAKE